MGKGGKGKPVSEKKAAKEGLVEKNGSATRPFQAVLAEIFRRFDKDRDGVWNMAELDAFARASQTGNITKEDRTQLGTMFDVDAKGDLTPKGFEQMYLMQTAHDPMDVWKDLERLGYSKSLELLGDEQGASLDAAAEKSRKEELMAALSALKLEPESAAAHRRVGAALTALGRAEAAQKSLAKATELEGVKGGPVLDVTDAPAAAPPTSTIDEQD